MVGHVISITVAVALLTACATNAPRERPLDVSNVEDARALRDAWSRAPQPGSPVHPRDYLAHPEVIGSATLERALAFMRAKLDPALDRARDGAFREEDAAALQQVAEVDRALELAFKDPVRRKQSLELGVAKKLAEVGAYTSLRETHEGVADPPDSSFWTRPRNLSALDLRIGFGRRSTLATDLLHRGRPCRFDEAKVGYGTNPGFTVACGNQKIKVKFRELRSEPFASRILWALGYNVEPVDYVAKLDFTYEAGFFTRINKRKNLAVDLTLLGITVHRVELTKRVDPFTLLQGARLTDGTWVDAAQLRARLVKTPGADPLALEPSDLDEEFARQIASLTTGEAQVQAKDESVLRIGPWQWEDFDHPARRETRGLLAAAAWLGWYDCRFDNNRVALVRTASGQTELRHFITDLGAALGFSSGWFTYRYERPEDMEESVTARGWFGDAKIVHYKTLEPNRAFARATADDVRWGAAWLSRLSDRQIHDAAIGAGFDEARARVVVEKLHARLIHMKRALGPAAQDVQHEQNRDRDSE